MEDFLCIFLVVTDIMEDFLGQHFLDQKQKVNVKLSPVIVRSVATKDFNQKKKVATKDCFSGDFYCAFFLSCH